MFAMDVALPHACPPEAAPPPAALPAVAPFRTHRPRTPRLWSLLCVAGWLALWWLATALQWVPPLFLPAPEAALNALAQAWRGDIQGGDALWVHAQWSCLRVFGAFALGLAKADRKSVV